MSEETKLSTWGVKVTDEVRKKIRNALESSGLSGNEFIEDMVTLYQTNRMKEHQPILTQDISELETITRRILSMYVGLGERIKTVMDEKERQAHVKGEQDRETIYLLHDKIKKLEEENTQCVEAREQAEQEAQALRERIRAMEDEYTLKVNGLTELLSTNRALIEEYKQKNDNLTGLLGEYKQYKEAHTAIQADVAAKEKELLALQQTYRASQHEIELLQTAMLDGRAKHKAELETVSDKFTFECDKRLLQAEKDYQSQLQSVREDYNRQIREFFGPRNAPNPEKKTRATRA